MIIKPKSRGFICTTAHPEGCAENVREQVNYVKKNGPIKGTAKNVLIIGASTGYGLASRIVSTFACGANTIGIFFEKPSNGRTTASSGWYNTAEFEKLAIKEGCYAKSINGDAFSNEIKDKTIELIKKDLKKIDLVIYSLAAPRKIDPNTGEKYNSVLKPIGQDYTNKTINFHSKEVSEVSIGAATEKEISDTIEVMGGNDWNLWMERLKSAGVLSEKVITLAYSYIGPELTAALYSKGTIGGAKDHLLKTVDTIDKTLHDIGGKAYVSVNKALVTQASSAIPIIPLYISILFKLMKEKNTHEGCIEQCFRLYNERLYTNEIDVDDLGRIRVDDWELQNDIQEKVIEYWKTVTTESVNDLTDIDGYIDEFYKLFGFNMANVDYEKDIDPVVKIPSIDNE